MATQVLRDVVEKVLRDHAAKRGRWQLCFYGWRGSWRRCFYQDFRREASSLRHIYRWRLAVGPWDLRRWQRQGDLAWLED